MPYRRRLVISSLLVIGLVGVAGYFLDVLASADTGASAARPTVTAGPVPTVRALPSPSPRPTPTAPVRVLALTDELPAEGSGEFRFGEQSGDRLGEAGALHRYRIAVEEEIDEDPDELGEFVDTTLAHPRGWTAGGDYRFQRVAGDDGYDFTIYLATSATAARLCAEAGLEVLSADLPEGGVSCRTPGHVVLNLHRWHRSVDHFVDAEIPLTAYRQMVLNHEIGHELGYGHEGCPDDGELAPVMQQQTLLLDGCRANPWPYQDGERLVGPPVP